MPRRSKEDIALEELLDLLFDHGDYSFNRNSVLGTFLRILLKRLFAAERRIRKLEKLHHESSKQRKAKRLRSVKAG